MERLSKVIKALASPLRLKIILLLLRYDRLSVSDLVEKTGETQSLISHHLSVLREAGLVKVQERKRYRYYSIDKDNIKALASELMIGLFDKKTRERIIDFLLDVVSQKIGENVKDHGKGRGEGYREDDADIRRASRHD